MDYSKLEEILHYQFHNKELLDTAFTHKSYVNESHTVCESYERLEFLGDSILEFVSSDVLYRVKKQMVKSNERYAAQAMYRSFFFG